MTRFDSENAGLIRATAASVPSAVASTVVVAAMIRLFTIAERQSGDDAVLEQKRHSR